jgi:ribonuclease Z
VTFASIFTKENSDAKFDLLLLLYKRFTIRLISVIHISFFFLFRHDGTIHFVPLSLSQLQIQRTSSVKPSKINKIFLTHAHGDHTFGLPGLLCLMGQDRDRLDQPVDIYGPEGLRMWLRVAIRYSISRIVPPYRVHELKDIPMAPEWEYNPRNRRYFYRGKDGMNRGWKPLGASIGQETTSWTHQANRMPFEASIIYGEVDGGRDIYPIYHHEYSSDCGSPIWEVEVSADHDVHVYAAPMSHGVPCVGYAVNELPRPGRLRQEYVEPIVRRNLPALKEVYRVPMKVMSIIKNLRPGGSFRFPDGTIVHHEDAVESPRQGRKVVICGDTCSSRAMVKLAYDADVIVHEATNTFLAGVDRSDLNQRLVERETIYHGHSTPQMAGLFAKQAQAQRLVLNHFSARYKGDLSIESLSFMMRMEEQAMQSAGLNETQVVAAWDLMTLPIPLRNER